jgi:hypothetical protein
VSPGSLETLQELATPASWNKKEMESELEIPMKQKLSG